MRWHCDTANFLLRHLLKEEEERKRALPVSFCYAMTYGGAVDIAIDKPARGRAMPLMSGRVYCRLPSRRRMLCLARTDQGQAASPPSLSMPAGRARFFFSAMGGVLWDNREGGRTVPSFVCLVVSVTRRVHVMLGVLRSAYLSIVPVTAVSF